MPTISLLPQYETAFTPELKKILFWFALYSAVTVEPEIEYTISFAPLPAKLVWKINLFESGETAICVFATESF